MSALFAEMHKFRDSIRILFKTLPYDFSNGQTILNLLYLLEDCINEEGINPSLASKENTYEMSPAYGMVT